MRNKANAPVSGEVEGEERLWDGCKSERSVGNWVGGWSGGVGREESELASFIEGGKVETGREVRDGNSGLGGGGGSFVGHFAGAFYD